MDDDIPSDQTKLYFVRVKGAGAAVGLFWSDWNGLDLLIPRHIDPGVCEAAEIWPLAGVVFLEGPVLHHGVVANEGPHRCMLTGGLAQTLFDDGGGEFATPIGFMPLHNPPNLPALFSLMTNEELLAQWNEVLNPLVLTESEAVLKQEIQRRGLPI